MQKPFAPAALLQRVRDVLGPPAAPEPMPAAVPAAVPTPAPSTATGGARILVVDDEPGLVNLVSEILRGDGHAVTIAASGEEALERLTAVSFDLVIVDLALGAGLSGWDVAAHVRAQQPGARVVLATGWGTVDLEEARAAGIETVLPKPYQIAELRRLAAPAALRDGATPKAPASYQAV